MACLLGLAGLRTLLGRVCAGCLCFVAGGLVLRAGDRSQVQAGWFEPENVNGGWDQGTVTALVQSREGYLWLGTYHGLVRFDGVRYTTFDHSNTPELQNGLITSLYETTDSVLWIGHETGHLTRYAAGQFAHVPLDPNWPGGTIEGITSDEKGDVWLLNNSGVLFRLRDGKTATVPGGASASRKVAPAREVNGRNWMVVGGKVSTLENAQVVPFEFAADTPADYYERVLPARDGSLWVVTSERLRKWVNAAWSELSESFARPPGTITVLLETGSGVLLAGTLHDGLYILKQGAQPVRFDHASGLSHNWVRCLWEDQEGNLWLGTGAGFDGLRRRKVQLLAAPDSWQGCGPLSFAMEPGGSCWIGTEGAGLYRFDAPEAVLSGQLPDGQGSWSCFGESAGLSNAFVWAVLKRRTNELLVGTWGGGIYQLQGRRFESPAGLSAVTDPVACLYEDREGVIWIGTSAGVHRYYSGRITWSAGPDKLVLPDVRAITETRDGTMWFGMSGGGIASLKNGLLRQYLQSSGLGSDYVLCLQPDIDGSLWIGTSDNGLIRFKEGKFSILGLSQGLPTTVIYHLVDDRVGNLWMGSQAGILRAAKTDLNRCADGLADSVSVLSLGHFEGLGSRGCAGGFQPGACQATDGRLYFPTPKGLAIVDPLELKPNPVKPPVLIEEVLADGQPVALNWSATAAPALRIGPGKGRIEFRYTALSFAVPQKVRFKHRLEGVDSHWIEVGAARSVEYNLMRPGTYRFQVIACNNDGLWNEKGASLAVVLLPWFWETWWFQSICGAGILGFVGSGALAVTRRRLRRKLEQLEKQRALERERARIARDIHDDLGASLTRISLLSQSVRGEVEGQPELDAQIDQIYSTARQLTRALDEIVWAVNPKHDTLDSLVTYLGRFAQQFLSAAGLRCRLDVPMHLPAWPLTSEIRHNVYLALKESLNNVVKHAAATEVRISLELQLQGFALLIADNGKGFVFSPELESHAISELQFAAGNGIANIRKRLEEVGSRCDWDTAPGEGTRVKLFIAVPGAA